MTRNLRSLAMAATASLMMAGVGRAEQPVAVILDVEGVTTPEIAAFDELSEGARLGLADGTLLRLSAYETCAEYEVVGGVVEVRNGQITLSGNSEVHFSAADCIANVTLSDADVVSAGVVTRTGSGDLPEISARPSFGVAGPGADGYDRLTVMIDNETVMTLPVVDRRAAFPAGAASLAAEKDAVVLISGANAQQRAVRVRTNADAAPWTILK
ncbi:MAG: hypothetical protein AAFV19_23375 [Pseudomonadota bacterium]